MLGHRIKAGGGEHDGEQVLDILAAHPSTARFIATKLVRRFVSDTPPAPLVDRAAARFSDTDGDIREVMRTILTSPEFLAPEAYRAKVKSPFEFIVERHAGDGGRRARRHAACARAAATRHAALRLPAADRLQRHALTPGSTPAPS